MCVSSNKKNILLIICILILLVIIGAFIFFGKPSLTVDNEQDQDEENVLDNISIIDIDNKGKNYKLIYNEQEFRITYTYDHWKIYDSYKIRNMNDIKNICQKLINIHPIHGKDRVSYRTAEDMAYEWLQHNLAYDILPDNNKWRKNAKDVDLDPDDQGRSMKEIYEDRTGEKFNIDSIIK